MLTRRTFETRGPVDPSRNYVVPRTEDVADLVHRMKEGRYIVISASRQTGKTTFFRWALNALVADSTTYLPIQLNFEEYRDIEPVDFYGNLKEDLVKEIERYFRLRQFRLPASFRIFLDGHSIRDHISMRRFFEQLPNHLPERRIAIIIDEFDGIPQAAMSAFLHSLRQIYLSASINRCPYSLGIVGVKSITQLNYDRSISPFNIQDEFRLPNFTLDQVRQLFGQYTDEVGGGVSEEVIKEIHLHTDSQPFLVNRLAQILTQEIDIPRTETITPAHFESAYQRILREQNVNISHLVTNTRRHRRFETLLMEICSYEKGVPYNIHNEFISELATYGVLKEGEGGFCEVANPIYQYCIVQAFQPLFNGLERDYLPEDTDAGFLDYDSHKKGKRI